MEQILNKEFKSIIVPIYNVEKLTRCTWNKIYRKESLVHNLLLIGKFYEDYIIHNIFMAANNITFVDEALNYYLQKSGFNVNSSNQKTHILT